MVSQLDVLDLMQRTRPDHVSGATRRQDRARTIVGPSWLGRHQESAVTRGLKRGVLSITRLAAMILDKVGRKLSPRKERYPYMQELHV